MLPPYVYDLIAAVQKWEDEHGDTSTCFENVLCAVPKQELDRAAAIAHYRQERDRMERALEDEAPSNPKATGGLVRGGELYVVGEAGNCTLRPYTSDSPREVVQSIRAAMVGADDAFCPACGNEGRPLHQSPSGVIVCRECSRKDGN